MTDIEITFIAFLLGITLGANVTLITTTEKRAEVRALQISYEKLIKDMK